MSLDYPLYEEMLRRKSRAAKYWRAGDVLYYLGLLPLVLSPFLYLLANGARSVPLFKTDLRPVAGAVALVSLLVFLSGSFLKSVSYTIAKKEGIDIQKY
ncbi:MAG: hypothetical protein PHV36_09510 [Elusimicrobiales bacterium]|nr:hypothetical protein [Elusimicrobiales bacterium]